MRRAWLRSATGFQVLGRALRRTPVGWRALSSVGGPGRKGVPRARRDGAGGGAAADRRWRYVLLFERGVRERATQLRDQYLARAALRSWGAAVVGREPAERGMSFVVDQLEAEAMAGGPPSDEDLAPYRAAADAVALEFFVSALARELASIRQAVGA